MTKSWLNKNGIPFIEKHVEEDGVAAELMGQGYRVTPVVIINGEAVVGYSPRKLEEALK